MKIEHDMTEPLKVYNYFLKDEVHLAAEAYFDGLVMKNGIDPEYNRHLVRDLAKARKAVNEFSGKLNGKKTLRTISIIGIVLCFVAAIIVLIASIANWSTYWWLLFISIALIAVGVGLIFLIVKV